MLLATAVVWVLVSDCLLQWQGRVSVSCAVGQRWPLSAGGCSVCRWVPVDRQRSWWRSWWCFWQGNLTIIVVLAVIIINWNVIKCTSFTNSAQSGTVWAGVACRRFFLTTAVPVNSFVATKWLKVLHTCVCSRGSSLDFTGGAYVYHRPPSCLVDRRGRGETKEGTGIGTFCPLEPCFHEHPI